MLLSKNMIADGCALSLLQVCIVCAVACPNKIIELTMAVCKRDVNDSIGLWLDGIAERTFFCDASRSTVS